MRRLEDLYVLFLYAIFSIPAKFADSILLLDLKIPPFVKEGESVKLECVYDLEYDGLYSLKWYKDDIEFYTYIPRMRDGMKQRFFDVPGVQIDREHSNDHEIVLHNVSVVATEGIYKCQVSGEGPLFATEVHSKKLRVAVIPKGRPQIEDMVAPKGGGFLYKPGDWLSLNCTSQPSRPPTRLTWFVNGREAPDVMIRKFNPSPTIEDMQQIAAIDKTELKASTLGLQFWVTPDHFDLGKLKVKCRGQIPAVYHMESDNLVVGQHNGPEHKVLQATSTSTSDLKGFRFLQLIMMVLMSSSINCYTNLHYIS